MADDEVKAKKRKKRRRKPREATVYYVFEINDWEWSFSFGINTMKDERDPYMDFRHLHLRTKLMRPSKLSVSESELVFLPRDDLKQAGRERDQPKAVGSLELYRGNLRGLFSIPSDVLSLLLQMLTANRLRFAVLQGAKLRYGHTMVQSFRLEMTIGADDLPPED